MSEEILIEIGASTQKFQRALQNVNSAVNGLARSTANIKVTGLNQGLANLNKATEKNKRGALTLKDAFKEIGAIKVSNKSLKDIKEITREFLRIVKELGPVITLAMNALDRPLQKAVLSMVKLLTEVERANSNFLVLRKVLPIRLFNTLSVNSQRLGTAIKGVAKDFTDMGKGVGKAVNVASNAMKKLFTTTKEVAGSSKILADNLSSGKISQGAEAYNNISKSVSDYASKLRKSVQETAEKNAILKKSLSTLSATSKKYKEVATATNKYTQSLRAFSGRVGGAIGSSRLLSKSLSVLGKGTLGALSLAFKGLTGSIQLTATAFAKLGASGAKTAIPAIAKTTRVATNAVKTLGSSILSITSAPFKLVSGAVSGLFGALKGSIGIIGAVVTGVASLGYALGNVAQNSVIAFRKNWIKVLSEVPRATKTSTDKMKQDLQSLQDEVGILSRDALPALQKALKIGFPQGSAIDVLRQASKLAISEIVDLEEGVNLLGRTMQVFAGQGITAEQAVDKLYTASKLGGISLEQLGSAIQRAGPQIAGTGVAFDDFAGSLAVLVRSGRLTYQALQDISGLTQAIASPSAEARKNFESLGIEFGKAGLEGRGLAGILTDIVNATGGSEKAMLALLGSQANLNTALTIGQNEGANFSDALKGIANSAGSAKEQAEKIDTTFQRVLRRAKVIAEQLMLDLGKLMSPAIKSVNDFVTEYTQKIKNAVAVGMQLFKNGDLGEVLKLSLEIGIAKGLVALKNFATKVGAGLSVAIAEGLTMFIEVLPSIKKSFKGLWDSFANFAVGSLGTILQGVGILSGSLKGLLIKAISEAWEFFTSKFGGSFKAQDLSVLIEQSIDENSIRKIGKKFSDLATNIEDESTTTTKEIRSKVLPTIISLGKAVKDAFEGAKANEEVSKDVLNKIAKLEGFLAKATANIEATARNTKETAGDVATTGDLLGQKLTDKDGNNGNQGEAIARIVATGLARVGGGGNVAGQRQLSKLETLIDRATEQVKAIKATNLAIEGLQLGEVR